MFIYVGIVDAVRIMVVNGLYVQYIHMITRANEQKTNKIWSVRWLLCRTDYCIKCGIVVIYVIASKRLNMNINIRFKKKKL